MAKEEKEEREEIKRRLCIVYLGITSNEMNLIKKEKGEERESEKENFKRVRYRWYGSRHGESMVVTLIKLN